MPEEETKQVNIVESVQLDTLILATKDVERAIEALIALENKDDDSGVQMDALIVSFNKLIEITKGNHEETQKVLQSLVDVDDAEEKAHREKIIETLLALPKNTDSLLEKTNEGLKELTKTSDEGLKAVVQAIKEIEFPEMPEAPETEKIDLSPITKEVGGVVSFLKGAFDSFTKKFSLFGTKKQPVFVVMIDEKGNPVQVQKIENHYSGGGNSGVSLITDAKGNGINPATSENQASGNDLLTQMLANLDKLQFDVDGNLKVASTGGGGSGGDVSILDVYVALKQMINSMERNITIDPSTGQMRVLIGNASVAVTGTLTGVTTVATVTTLNQLAGFDAKQTLLYSQDRSTWGNIIRNRIV